MIQWYIWGRGMGGRKLPSRHCVIPRTTCEQWKFIK